MSELVKLENELYIPMLLEKIQRSTDYRANQIFGIILSYKHFGNEIIENQLTYTVSKKLIGNLSKNRIKGILDNLSSDFKIRIDGELGEKIFDSSEYKVFQAFSVLTLKNDNKHIEIELHPKFKKLLVTIMRASYNIGDHQVYKNLESVHSQNFYLNLLHNIKYQKKSIILEANEFRKLAGAYSFSNSKDNKKEENFTYEYLHAGMFKTRVIEKIRDDLKNTIHEIESIEEIKVNRKIEKYKITFKHDPKNKTIYQKENWETNLEMYNVYPIIIQEFKNNVLEKKIETIEDIKIEWTNEYIEYSYMCAINQFEKSKKQNEVSRIKILVDGIKKGFWLKDIEIIKAEDKKKIMKAQELERELLKIEQDKKQFVEFLNELKTRLKGPEEKIINNLELVKLDEIELHVNFYHPQKELNILQNDIINTWTIIDTIIDENKDLYEKFYMKKNLKGKLKK